MKKWMMGTAMTLVMVAAVPRSTPAQVPIVDIVTTAIKKVIVAIDLKVQQMQNKTLWLQNAQKELENKLSETKLKDISDWSNRQKQLYSDYYDQLKKVKNAIAAFRQVRDVVNDQLQLVKEYKAAYNRFRADKNFSPEELEYIGRVYQGIIDASVRNLDELMLAVNSFKTSMTDGQRLEMIQRVSAKIAGNLSDLRQFNSQNSLLSRQRDVERNDAATMKKIYGQPKN